MEPNRQLAGVKMESEEETNVQPPRGQLEFGRLLLPILQAFHVTDYNFFFQQVQDQPHNVKALLEANYRTWVLKDEEESWEATLFQLCQGNGQNPLQNPAENQNGQQGRPFAYSDWTPDYPVDLQTFRQDVERVFVGEMVRNVNENGGIGEPQHFGPEFANPVGHWLLNDNNGTESPMEEEGPEQQAAVDSDQTRNIHGLLTDALNFTQEADILEPNPEIRQICALLENRLHELETKMRNEQ